MTELVVHPRDLFLQRLRFVPQKISEEEQTKKKKRKKKTKKKKKHGLRTLGGVPEPLKVCVKPLKARGLRYSALALWEEEWGRDPSTPGVSHLLPRERVCRWRGLVKRAVRVRGQGAPLFPGVFVPLGLRAASPGLCLMLSPQTGQRKLPNLSLRGLCA